MSNSFMLTRKGYEENKQNVSAAMFLATAYDKASEAWTRFCPNVSELKRLVAYARSSANLLNKLILQDQIDSYKWECLWSYDTSQSFDTKRTYLTKKHHTFIPRDGASCLTRGK